MSVIGPSYEVKRRNC